MNQVDLDRYKNIWNDEGGIESSFLSKSEIASFMRYESKDLLSRMKRSLLFDIALKVVLLIFLGVLVTLVLPSARWTILCLIIAGTIVGTIALQTRAVLLIPIVDPGNQNTLTTLSQYISYYYKHYYRSIFVSALSSVYFFITGALYYFFYKYDGLPSLKLDDIVILGVLLILNFTLSSVAQLRATSIHINELRDRILEIQEGSLSTTSLVAHYAKKKRTFWIVGITLILGLMLLMYVLYIQTH